MNFSSDGDRIDDSFNRYMVECEYVTTPLGAS